MAILLLVLTRERESQWHVCVYLKSAVTRQREYSLYRARVSMRMVFQPIRARLYSSHKYSIAFPGLWELLYHFDMFVRHESHEPEFVRNSEPVTHRTAIVRKFEPFHAYIWGSNPPKYAFFAPRHTYNSRRTKFRLRTNLSHVTPAYEHIEMVQYILLDV